MLRMVLRKNALLLSAFLCIFPAFAQEGSHPFIGIGLGISNSAYHASIPYRAERLNFPLEANLGYEFSLFGNFRSSIAVLLARGGWNWEIDGYGGSIRYIYPAIDLSIFLPKYGDLAGISFYYGLAKLTKKFDNIYANENTESGCTILGNTLFYGFKIYDNYRIIFKYEIGLLRNMSGRESFAFLEESLRLYIQYDF